MGVLNWIEFMYAELMLLGFISLLLTVFQSRILKICISQHKADIWLPCKRSDDTNAKQPASTSHFQTAITFISSFGSAGARRHLLSESSSAQYCPRKVFTILSSLFLFNCTQLWFIIYETVKGLPPDQVEIES